MTRKSSVKPEVLIYTNHLLGYSETFIRAQGEALCSFSPQFLGSYDVTGGLEIATAHRHILRSCWRGKLADMALKLGVLTPYVARLLKRLQPCLIHAHFGPNGLTALAMSAHMGVPLVTTFHGFDVTIAQPTRKSHGWLHLRYLRRRDTLAQRGALFIAVSDFIRTKLLQQGFPAARVIRHYIGVDTAFFAPDPAVARDGSVVMVGRMVPYKGHALLLQAMAKVQAQIPTARLVLVGDGPERTALEAMAQQLGVDVCFTGKQTPEQVRHWLRQAAVYCQTSIRMANGHEEALALAIAEAQAVATPAVVFDSGGMPEALLPNHSGLVVDCGNVDALATAILRLLQDQEMWAAFSAESVRQVRERHDLHRQSAMLEQIYHQVLASTDNHREGG